MMSGNEEREITIRPTLDEWEKLEAVHREIADREFQMAASAFIESMARYTEERSGYENLNLGPSEREIFEFPQVDFGIDDSSGLTDEADWKWEVYNHVPGPYDRFCPTSIIWPPFNWGYPTTPKIVRAKPSNHLLSLQYAVPSTGRMELGAAVTAGESVSVVGDFRVSKASAYLAIGRVLSPITDPTTVTVQVDVVVDAWFAIGSGGVVCGLTAGVRADLVLRVTSASTGVPLSNSKSICSLKAAPFGFIVDKLSSTPFTSSVSFDVNSPDYIIASLHAEVVTTAQKEEEFTWKGKSYTCGVTAGADMEGFSNPPGELPYKASGSIFVPGFIIKMCPKI